MNVSRAGGACDYESEESPWDVAFRFYVNGVLLNVVGALGVVGNALCMAVLSRPQMRSGINCLLVWLARCDTVLVVTSLLLFGLPGVYPHTGRLRHYYYAVYPRIAPLAYPLACVAQTGSVYLTLAVTAERWVAVCHPLRARSLCTRRRARRAVLTIVAVAFLYNLPKFWETEVVRATLVRADNVTDYCVQPAAFRDELYITVYVHWMYLVFMYIVPFSCLAVLNALIYAQVRRANAERARLSRLQRREIGLATMLLVVVLVFFACNLLALVINTLESCGRTGPDPLVRTSNLLVTLNSSVNFLIYVIFGEKFKRVFLEMFCRRVRATGRESPDGATHDDSLVSNGEARMSWRLQRHPTLSTHNGDGSVRRAPGAGPLVYYPPPPPPAAPPDPTLTHF